MQIKVYATPGARRESVEKESDTVFRIKVREPREGNLANKRIRQVLAATLQVDEKVIRLTKGHHSGVKVYEVMDVLLDKN